PRARRPCCEANGFWITSSMIRSARRGWGRRIIEEVIQNPFASQHGRRARGVRGNREDAGLREDSAALIAGEGHAAELGAGDAGNAVMLRQTLIEESKFAVYEIQNAA